MTRHHGSRCGPSRKALGAASALFLSLTLSLSGCTGSDFDGPFSGDESENEGDVLATTSKIGLVQGTMTGRDRVLLEQAVVAAVDSWIDVGFAGPYPREEFSGAFKKFTRGAAKDAQRDQDLMTNAEVDAESVELTKRWVRVDVVALNKRPVGVTARIAIEQQIDDAERVERLTGSLFLSQRKSGWKVFGYDIKRGLK